MEICNSNASINTFVKHNLSNKEKSNITYRILERRKKRNKEKRETKRDIKIDLYNSKILANIEENIHG